MPSHVHTFAIAMAMPKGLKVIEIIYYGLHEKVGLLQYIAATYPSIM